MSEQTSLALEPARPVTVSTPQPAVNAHEEASMTPEQRREHQMRPVERTIDQPPSTGDRIKIGENEFTAEDLQALAQHKATEDVRKASLPASADAYELKLPDDFKAPAGVEFKFATDDPVLSGVIQQAQAFAHANGLSQEQFSGMMGLYAASMSQQESFITTARAAEVDKLGVNGSARVDAVSRWLKAHLGDELAGPMLQTLATAKHVDGFEKLIHKMSSQGGAGFSQPHRAQSDGKPTDEEYSGW
jgi:hypothetical protein